MKTFVESFVGDYMFDIKPNQFRENKIKSSQKAFQPLEDSSEFLINCVYYPGNCLIAFLNGEYDSEIKRVNLDHKSNLNLLRNTQEDLGNNFPQMKMFYVNATCHGDFSASFEISLKKMPNMVLYQGQFKSYFKMNDEFTKENIESFVKGSFEGKRLFKKIEAEEILFANENCSTKKDKLKEVDYEKIQRIRKGLEDEEVEEEENAMKKDL